MKFHQESFNPEQMNFVDISFLTKLKEFTTQAPNLSIAVKPGKYYDSNIEKLKELSDNLKDELNYTKKIKGFVEKLIRCQKLFKFDQFLDKDFHFHEIYNKFYDEFKKYIKDMVEKSKKSLENSNTDYKTILTILDEFSDEGNSQYKRFLDINKEEIIQMIRVHFENVNNNIMDFLKKNQNTKSLITKDYYLIFEDLKKLSKSKSKELQKLIEFEENSTQQFYIIFFSHIEKIKIEFRYFHYQQAEALLLDLENIIAGFGQITKDDKYIELQIEIINIKKEREKSFIQLLKNIDDMKLEISELDRENAFDNPKVMFESLKKMIEQNSDYLKLFKEYYSKLKAKSEHIKQELNNKYELESIKIYLPEEFHYLLT